ncbi:hypothetical protein HPB51_013488 [Rhipicephalus microplus]|uniref:RNA helicase n=1 Tax=Rhipicephalus microplus TaxID=6941 RepID=A0A9J6EN53_RHIMP|nr:hypothetical protein HPB51_013488 [Rhipicephalus microplus]
MTTTNRINGLHGREHNVSMGTWWDKLCASDMFKYMPEDETADLRQRGAEYKSCLTSDAVSYIAPTPMSLHRLRPLSIYQDESSKWSAADVKAYRIANEITVTGRAVPKPISRLAEVDIPDHVTEGAEALDYCPLTAVQSQCWPIALAGRDLLAVIYGQSGENSRSYLIPAIVHVISQPTPQPVNGPCVLVLVPTRQSSVQVHRQVTDFEKYATVHSLCLCSGDWKERQLKRLSKASFQIWIATPSRLLSFIENGKVSLTSTCTFLVLDEVDTMLAVGFEKKLRTIASLVGPTRQTLMFTASRPTALIHIAEDLLEDYVQVGFGQSKIVENVEHFVVFCEKTEKMKRLVALLDDVVNEKDDKVIVFAGNKRSVEEIVSELRLRGRLAMSIHGTKSRLEREWALDGLRSGVASVLVMTDVMTQRVVDVGAVHCIVNYENPASGDVYASRVSYASRCQSSGSVYTFLAPDDTRNARELISYLVDAGKEVHPRLRAIAKGTPFY